MLDVGTIAPNMQLTDSSGAHFQLKDYRDNSNVLMYFMRSTTCPACNGHVKDLVARASEFDANDITVIVAVPEDQPDAVAWASKVGVPFRVAVGTASSTPHEAVGLTTKVFGAIQQSGSLLIDKSGIIRHAHAATVPVAAYDKKGISTAISQVNLSA